MHVENIAYRFDDLEMIGHFVYDDTTSGRRPAVVLAHEGPGLDEQVKGRAVRLAELGYAAFALDYLGGGAPPPIEKAMERLGVLMNDLALTRRLGLAGLDVLLAQDVTDSARVAAIGYCFGGTMALEIARSGADVKAVAGFHPGLPTSPDSKNIKGSVLMCVGAKDPLIGIDQHYAFEQDMAAAGITDWTLEVYGGVGHSFTNPAADALGIPGVGFDANADARSWDAMLRLFDATIAP